MLEGYRGLLHSDGYDAYPQSVAKTSGVTRLSCWAHARRKFTEALAKAPATAGFVLRLIGQFYRWEHEWDRLAQGFPDFDPPEVLLAALEKATRGPYHQYAIT